MVPQEQDGYHPLNNVRTYRCRCIVFLHISGILRTDNVSLKISKFFASSHSFNGI